MDIRGRSNYPFRAPLTGPRIIPPSGRPCVGLTRLSSDRVAERRRELGSGGGARGYGFGRAASKRKDRGRGEARAGERARRRSYRCGSRREAEATEGAGGRAEDGGWKRAKQQRQRQQHGGNSRREARGREDVESWAVAELARTKGICGSSRSLALVRSLTRTTLSFFSSSLRPRYAHTHTHTRVAATSRTHARAYTNAQGRAACNSVRARTHARRAAETAGTVGRGSARVAESLLSFTVTSSRFIFLLFFPSPPSPSVLFYVRFFYPSSSSRVDRGGGR